MDQTLEIVETTTLVGRGRDCGLVLVDPSVSRVHSRLLVRPDGAVLVEDVGSANGLFVNDKRVKVWQLAGGDRVRFGSVEFLVELPGSSTIQMPALPSRMRRLLRSAFARAIVVAAVVLLVVLLALVLTPFDSRLERFQPASRPTQSATSSGIQAPPSTSPPGTLPPETPADAQAASGALARARSLLADRRLEEARKEVATALALEPANAEAVRLTNRLDLENLARAALRDADRALADGRLEEVVQDLFSIPLDSGYADDAKERMRSLLPQLERARDKACPGRGATTFPCIRWKALKAKVEAASR
jgi:3D (Asp-Asp-Asp) domain-containing protein